MFRAYLYIILFCGGNLFAQECTIPKSFEKETFKIEYDKKTAKQNQDFLSVIKIKSPKKGKDIKDKMSISCNLKIPDFGNVLHIKVLRIKNLPEGVTWTSNKKNHTFKKSETGCLFLKGKPKEKGTFNLEIETEGLGSFLMIKRKVKCTVSGFNLTVK